MVKLTLPDAFVADRTLVTVVTWSVPLGGDAVASARWLLAQHLAAQAVAAPETKNVGCDLRNCKRCESLGRTHQDHTHLETTAAGFVGTHAYRSAAIRVPAQRVRTFLGWKLALACFAAGFITFFTLGSLLVRL